MKKSLGRSCGYMVFCPFTTQYKTVDICNAGKCLADVERLVDVKSSWLEKTVETK